MLPKGYRLGIAVEVEIEDFANLERNEKLGNNTRCSINVVRSDREENVHF